MKKIYLVVILKNIFSSGNRDASWEGEVIKKLGTDMIDNLGKLIERWKLELELFLMKEMMNLVYWRI